MKQFDLVIVGGGTAGITTAAHVRKRFKAGALTVAIVDPSDKHYYQPLWTVVGAGVVKKESTERAMQSLLPPGVEFIKGAVQSFQPEDLKISLEDGSILGYKYLIVCAGMQLNWDRIDGLMETLGKNNVASNYRYDLVDYAWESIRNTRDGNAIFTQPPMPIKCAGAPQKICYMAEDYFRTQKRRKDIDVRFCAQGPAIFGVPKYKEALEKVVARKEISTFFEHNLVEVDGPSKTAIFQKQDSDERVNMPFSMLHVTPPMSAPDFISQSSLADASGYVEVDKYTLQHKRYPNIFSAGDCSNLPTSRTGAAVRKQIPVLVENLRSVIEGKELLAQYDGYASCPLVTGYGTAILAEFGYDGKIMETFPFDQGKERLSMYLLKVYGLPKLYWNGMLKGYA